MPSRTRLPLKQLLSTLVLILYFCLSNLMTPYAAATVYAAQSEDESLQKWFSEAAHEWDVPQEILLAVAYNLSRWEHHDGAPSSSGGYGFMHLSDPALLVNTDAKGDEATTKAVTPGASGTVTLDSAAALLRVDRETLKKNPAQNVRGGAALLAQYARETLGRASSNPADWYGAVARFSGSDEAAIALDFADSVFATLQEGASHTTSSGERITLVGQNIEPNKFTAAGLGLRYQAANAGRADCPANLACDATPAAYKLNNPPNLEDYGNYDLANRGSDGLDIRYIVIHNTEGSYSSVTRHFQNSRAYSSAHYMVRSSDGRVAQFVENKNIAWHAGNWYVNMHSIGIEHEGIAIEGAKWYSEAMYRASAKLTSYLIYKYKIPFDRAHIIGHDEIPGVKPGGQFGMHWDPGPFWDWTHYMELVETLLNKQPGTKEPKSPVVTIQPVFAKNKPGLSYCYKANDCRDLPNQAANFLYVYTAPRHDAPLVSNPYLTRWEANRAYNWGNKALTGQQFYRADQKGDWEAIYFSGQKGWIFNPRSRSQPAADGDSFEFEEATTTQTAIPTPKPTPKPTPSAKPGNSAAPELLIRPKKGISAVPVWGAAYPELEAYPAGVRPIVPEMIYTIPAGQVYIANELVKATYYQAKKFGPTLQEAGNMVILGQTQFYRINFNHRFAYVKASDVEVVPPKK